MRVSHCSGFSCCGARALGNAGLRSYSTDACCSAPCGIFPDQGSNPGPLHWQVDSYPPCCHEHPEQRLLKGAQENVLYPAVDEAVSQPGPLLILTVIPTLSESCSPCPGGRADPHLRSPDPSRPAGLSVACYPPLTTVMPSVLFEGERGTAAHIHLGSEAAYRVSWTVANPTV